MNADATVSMDETGAFLGGSRRWDLFWTAVWFGLAAGFLELILLILRVELQEKGFFLRSRHFVWMVPVSDLILFATMGLAASWFAGAIGGRSYRVVLGVFLFAGCLSQLMLVRGLSSITCMLLAGGVAVHAAPWLEARSEGLRRWIRRTLPALIAVLVVLAAVGFVRDARGSVWRRGDRAAVPGEARNVLLIVLDTVRADRLSLYGYDRETTPNLKRLAERGVRFDQARAAASWTLPSHANMFTGRWPSELEVERLGWLDEAYPTLAEQLRDSGYATAGFVANPFFCGRGSGLSRGFQTYADYPITLGEVFRSSTVGWFLARGELRLRTLLGSGQTAGAVRDVDLDFSRKDAATVNGEFLRWLSRNGSQPFFAFLNYFDAHDPYLLPGGAVPRFRTEPLSSEASALLRNWQRVDKKTLTEREAQIASDAYDDCLAALDEQVGALLDTLQERGVLDETLLIITADHGEQFGEHGEFGHGLSLYDEETHVPLLISMPGLAPAGQTVGASASLRDLPATVLDLLGLAADSPFPGASLASAWKEPGAESTLAISSAFSELPGRVDEGAVQNVRDSRESWKSIVVDGHAYIRRGDGREELFVLASDPGQRFDRRDDPSLLDVLDACRNALGAVQSVEP